MAGLYSTTWRIKSSRLIAGHGNRRYPTASHMGTRPRELPQALSSNQDSRIIDSDAKGVQQMALKRQLWTPPFETFPSWPCPVCETGTMELIDGSLNIVETGLSRAMHNELPWEPTWIVERFTAMLECNNVECKEVAAVCGRTRHVDDHDYERQELNWTRLFDPDFFCKAPPIFPIPENCPDQIRRELKRAFSLIWSDIGSSANRLRSSIEVLLDEQKINKTKVTSGQKRVRLSLHERISLFHTKNADAALPLEAVKWLGNVGSHANFDTLDINDLLDGFELFEHAIERVYVRHQEHLKKLASEINKKKGKRRKPK